MRNLPLPVQAVISQENLAQVLWVAHSPKETEVPFQSAETVLKTAFQSRFDLVFIDCSCFALDKHRLLSLIAKSRDLLSSRVMIEWEPQSGQDWQEADFLALAMRRRAVLEDNGTERIYYSYDLKTYKQVPDWLNPKYWANPHMWDKARW